MVHIFTFVEKMLFAARARNTLVISTIFLTRLRLVKKNQFSIIKVPFCALGTKITIFYLRAQSSHFANLFLFAKFPTRAENVFPALITSPNSAPRCSSNCFFVRKNITYALIRKTTIIGPVCAICQK